MNRLQTNNNWIKSKSEKEETVTAESKEIGQEKGRGAES